MSACKSSDCGCAAPSYIITNSAVSATVDGKSYSVLRTNAYAERIIEAIVNKEFWNLPALFDKATAIRTFTHGRVTVKGTDVYYNGEQIKNAVVAKIVSFVDQNLKPEPLLKFLENLMLNPSKRAVDELYGFLEHEGLPITDDGCFLAYKAVRSDWKDLHTGTISNHIGAFISCDRNKVDDDPSHDCSYGYHAGSLEYVNGFSSNPTDHKVIVKINPRDVVSIPKHDARKLRCCAYSVVSEFKGKLNDTYEPAYWVASGPYAGAAKSPMRDAYGRFS